MNQETEQKNSGENIIYDADASQRYEFEVVEGGARYNTAHRFEPLSEERYVQHIKSARAQGNEQDVDENILETVVELWNDLIVEVENIETEPGEDWKSVIDSTEKQEALNSFLTVAIVEPEIVTGGKRKLSVNSTEKVITEAFFNGEPIQQTHVLQKKRDEWQKKYDRIEARRFQQEPTKGLRRKPQIKYFAQDEGIGKLYDEQFIEQTGFANGKIPLRFKTRVIHYLYGSSKLGEKK